MAPETALTPEVVEPLAPVAAAPDTPVVAAPSAPVAEAPAPATPPTSVAPAAPTPAPAVDPRVAEYIASLERQQRETQAKLDQEASVTAIARRQEALVAIGLDPAQAQAIATEIVQAGQQAATQVNERDAKWRYAATLADKHKVPIATLMQYATKDTMDAAVEKLAAEGAQATRIATLEAEVASLKKGQVPSQTFDSGRGDGSSPATSDNVDALWVAFDREHPDRKNPYEDGYRSFLRNLRQ